MMSVLLVEDHALFRQALAWMFEREGDFTVVAQIIFVPVRIFRAQRVPTCCDVAALGSTALDLHVLQCRPALQALLLVLRFALAHRGGELLDGHKASSLGSFGRLGPKRYGVLKTITLG